MPGQKYESKEEEVAGDRGEDMGVCAWQKEAPSVAMVT